MINKVFIIGNLGGDPEIRYTTNGNAVCNFSVATTEKWRGQDGQMQEQTDWHRVTAWGKLAEICNQYLSKGSRVYITGSENQGNVAIVSDGQSLEMRCGYSVKDIALESVPSAPSARWASSVMAFSFAVMAVCAVTMSPSVLTTLW